MKIIFIFLACFCVLKIYAQDKTAEKFAGTITPGDLKAKLSVIAGAEMKGRETATEGQRSAALYIENYFKRLKIQIVFITEATIIILQITEFQ